MEKENATHTQSSSVSKCESCSYPGGIIQHLLEEESCLSEYSNKYLPKGRSLEGDNEKRKSIMMLSFVLNLCALPSCSNRHHDIYLANHLTKNEQCLLFYQREGSVLDFPWNLNTSARVIGKRIHQIKRNLKDELRAEEQIIAAQAAPLPLGKGAKLLEEDFDKELRQVV